MLTEKSDTACWAEATTVSSIRKDSRAKFPAGWGLLLAAWICASGQVATKPAPGMRAAESARQQVLQKDLATARQGSTEAQLRVAKFYYARNAGKRDLGMAMQWFQKASDQGSAEATAWLGAGYLYGHGVGKDEKQAEILIRQAADKGDPVGLRFMGVLAEKAKDYSQAAEFYGRAKELGDGNASVRLAHMYTHGLGVAVDKGKAEDLLQQAAGQGDVWAQLRLGRLYEQGDRKAGIRKRPLLSVKYYGDAAAQGNRLAAYRLGKIYSRGYGQLVPRDKQKSFQYFKQSAFQGYAPALFELGRMKELGDGVEASPIAAYYWYSLGKRRGHEQSAERLLALQSKMSAEQVKTAEGLLYKHREFSASRKAAVGP